MVISAGNDGPNPFRVGGPSTTPNALSVGAMTHPSGTGAVFENNTVDGKKVTMLGSGFNPTSAFVVDQASDPAVKIPSVGISLEDGTAIKAALEKGAVNYSIKSVAINTAGGIATFTSRGPAMQGLLKPEITAPGTNILMAAVGSGD